jgi:hypothetical protein
MYTQGGSNMTGTVCVKTSHSLSRSYLNHLVYVCIHKGFVLHHNFASEKESPNKKLYSQNK